MSLNCCLIAISNIFRSLATNSPTKPTSNGSSSHAVRNPSPQKNHPQTHPLLNPNISISPTGSSQGRGPRCASWFLEHVREVAGDNDMQVLVLEGGVKGWVAGGPRFTSLMDGLKPEHWEEVLAGEEKKGGEDGK